MLGGGGGPARSISIPIPTTLGQLPGCQAQSGARRHGEIHRARAVACVGRVDALSGGSPWMAQSHLGPLLPRRREGGVATLTGLAGFIRIGLPEVGHGIGRGFGSLIRSLTNPSLGKRMRGPGPHRRRAVECTCESKHDERVGLTHGPCCKVLHVINMCLTHGQKMCKGLTQEANHAPSSWREVKVTRRLALTGQTRAVILILIGTILKMFQNKGGSCRG